MRRLYEDVHWALTSNPTGAAEVAGVLLGKTDSMTDIMDCQPVFLMQEQDHAYALAGPGRREFERTMGAFRSIPEGEVSVIGVYRSHMGDGLDVTEEDLGLMRACFGDSSAVLMLMKLSGDGSSSVRLFSGNEGQLLSEFRGAEDGSGLPRWLELWRNLSADRRPEVAKPEDPRETVDTVKLADQTDPPVSDQPEHPLISRTEEPQKNSLVLGRRLPRRPILLLAATAIVGALLAYPMFEISARLRQGADGSGTAARQAQASSSRYARLALRVEKEGDSVRLDWDRTAPVLAAATGAMLTIRGRNGPEKQILLDVNLLRTGAVMYGPVHGDVFLRLVIFGPNGRNLGESVARYPQRVSTTKSSL